MIRYFFNPQPIGISNNQPRVQTKGPNHARGNVNIETNGSGINLMYKVCFSMADGASLTKLFFTAYASSTPTGFRQWQGINSASALIKPHLRIVHQVAQSKYKA